ncbi:MAG: hypothetical protein F9K17_09485 [Phycisphaerae bacterium]|nr:MAG: hypothetical protein F9K17_09485 [Phycisphaerae bacterium]
MSTRHRISALILAFVGTAVRAAPAPQISGNDFEIDCDGACQLTFSLDIGSARELSSPVAGPAKGFDPGDLYDYVNAYAALTACGVTGGQDGIGDDERFLGLMFDPAPVAPDSSYGSAVPVGDGCDPDVQDCYLPFFDLDGHDLLNVDLRLLGFNPNAPLPTPLLQSDFSSSERNNIFNINSFFISFDDDGASGWPDVAGNVPVNSTAGSGATYGRTLGRDEVIGVRVTCAGGSCITVTRFPIGNEEWVHQELRGHPDVNEELDDDIDSIDYITQGASNLYFSADHEAHFGLEPGVIYLNAPMIGSSPISMVRPEVHLGLPARVDIDAFQFCWNGGVFVMLFSVDADDPLTSSVDESGGLKPNVVYGSALTGSYVTIYEDDAVLVDNIDAIALDSTDFQPNPSKLYGVTIDGNFVDINKETGEGTLLGNIGYAGDAMAADKDGNIFVMRDRNKLIQVYPESPETPDVTPLTVPDQGIAVRGLAISDDGVFIAALDAGDTDNDFLYRIDPETGTYDFTCEFDGLTDVQGLTLDRCGRLYGLDGNMGTFRFYGVNLDKCITEVIGDCNVNNRSIEFDTNDNFLGARFNLWDVDLMGECCTDSDRGDIGYEIKGIAAVASDCAGKIRATYQAGHTIEVKLVRFAPSTAYELLLEDASGTVVDFVSVTTGPKGKAGVSFTSFDCADGPHYVEIERCRISSKVKKPCT